ncbi:MAG: AraC family transcriptional regulator [Clostridia bacterium]|nr:AraC family transcriptional regulator [Clostridia bacterium]
MTDNNEKLYLSVTGIYYPEKNESFRWGPGVRDKYIIHYVREGKGYFECGGKKYTLTKGQSFLIVPGQLVNYYPDEKEPWKYTWVDFTGIEARKLLSYCSLSEENPIAEKEIPELDRLFREASDRFVTDSHADVCRNIGYFRLIFSIYIKHYPAVNSKSVGELLITRAAEFIENNYRRQELNIDMIAEYLSVNRVTLHRKFVDELKVSPGKYIIDLRIKKACMLLSNSNYSVKTVAYSTGFSDQLYFSKVFKKLVGTTPTEYRAKHK